MSTRLQHERLISLYEALDRRIQAAGPICSRSGNCCDFPRSGHILYATQLEVESILDRFTPPPPEQEGWCPFYQKRLCTLRALRPVGCRIYYCDPDYSDHRMNEISQWAHDEIRKIHDDLHLSYGYAPFLDQLKPLPE